MATKEKAVLLIDAQGDVVQPVKKVDIHGGLKVLVLSTVGKCCNMADGRLAVAAAEELVHGNLTDAEVVSILKKDLSTGYAKMETESIANNNFTFVKPWAKIRLYKTDESVVDVTKAFSSAFGKHMGRRKEDGLATGGGGGGGGMLGAPAIQLSGILNVLRQYDMEVGTIIMCSCRQKLNGPGFEGSTAGGGGAGGGGDNKKGGRKKKRRKRTRRRRRKRTHRRRRKRTRRRKRRRTRRRRRRRSRH